MQELFFNTPVRYKFLKKDYTEAGYIEDVITRLALVHPDIAFKLTNSGKTIVQTSGDGNIKNVVYGIYGKMVAGACLNVNYEYEGITITGVVGKPEIARSNRGNQIFFVNKRYVKDRILSNATEKAFKGLIPIGKFGFLIINLEMPASLVDVNVHPAKLEVRFQEEQKVFKAVYHSLQDTLLKAELIASSETPITGKFEKNNLEGEIMEEEQKSTISGLFRKIAKNADDDYENNNLIESIYKSKNENHDSDNMIESIYNSKNVAQEENHEEEKQIQDYEEKQENNLPNFETQNNTNNNYGIPNYASNYSQWLPPKQNTQSTANAVNETNENYENKPNEEAIKSTINEFMQMGKNLTAEQIREKIAKLAKESQEQAKVQTSTQNMLNAEKITTEGGTTTTGMTTAGMNVAGTAIATTVGTALTDVRNIKHLYTKFDNKKYSFARNG